MTNVQCFDWDTEHLLDFINKMNKEINLDVEYEHVQFQSFDCTS